LFSINFAITAEVASGLAQAAYAVGRRVNPEITALANQRLKMLCGKDGYSGIPHPQTKSVDKGKLHEESIEHWAARFHSWMTSI
jgi:hypothetical protein